MIPIEFDRVTYVEHGNYTRPLKESFPPGTLFLLGSWGESGGLLKLTRNKFVSITRDQAFGLAPLILDKREFWLTGEGGFELKKKGAEAPSNQAKSSLNSSDSSSMKSSSLLASSVLSSSASRSKG